MAGEGWNDVNETQNTVYSRAQVLKSPMTLRNCLFYHYCSINKAPYISSNMKMRTTLVLLTTSLAVAAESWPAKTHIELPLEYHGGRYHMQGNIFQDITVVRTDTSCTVAIGTPPQPVMVAIDTKTIDIWSNPDCSHAPPGSRDFCSHTGTFDPEESSTYQESAWELPLTYGESKVTVNQAHDDFTVAKDVTVKSLKFGRAVSSRGPSAGIVGLAYARESNNRFPPRKDNFLDKLRQQDFIRLKAFSLGLGKLGTNESSVIFGGLDTSKFKGPLGWLPIVEGASETGDVDGIKKYSIWMQSISASTPTGTPRLFPVKRSSALIDTMSPVTVLPRGVVKWVATNLGGKELKKSGVFTVDCDVALQEGSVDFDFGEVTIKVPYEELVHKGPDGCMLDIVGDVNYNKKRQMILGGSFLRSAYG